jgi:hypothetical protein
MNFNEIGILEIDGERVALRPLELRHEYGENTILKAEIMSIFQESNARSRKKNIIKNVIFNDPATIVIWGDGTKTVVKCQEGDEYNAELGLAMCISKKYFGNKDNFNEVFKKWIPEEKEISVNEMRNRLYKYCDEKDHHYCRTCPLKKPVCRCGCGTHFLTKKRNSDHYDMSDDEIRDAYKIVFGK